MSRVQGKVSTWLAALVATALLTACSTAHGPAPATGSVPAPGIWLWDKSGSFQLDTLTEGQL